MSVGAKSFSSMRHTCEASQVRTAPSVCLSWRRMEEELLLTKKRKMRREGALLSGAFKLTHPALAKLWEDSDSRRHTLAASPGSNGSQSSAPLNPGALPKAEPGRYSNAKVSVESCSSVASTKTRFSCSDLPQHISTGANSQPLVRAPRPLGVPRFQQSITHKAQVALSEESTLDFSLPLPVLPTEEKTTKDVERRSRKVSGVAAPPGDVKPPSDSPTNVTMATVQEAEPVPTPSPCDEGLRCEDGDKEGSTDSLDLCLEELSKSPHFDEYLRLIRQEAKPGAHLTKPFTFSYFDLYKLA